MSNQSVEDAIRQIVLANADGEIMSLAVVMINHSGEPEMQIAVAPGTTYAIVTGLEILKIKIIENLMNKGQLKPKERE